MIKKIILASVLLLSLPVFAGQWKVNIKDAEIDAFISQIADITGKSFIVDPRVKGRVTVISKASMDDAAVYQLFLSVLNVHGYVAVETEDGAVKVIPNATSKQEANRSSRTRGDSFITEVIQLKSATVAEVVPVLRPLVPQYGHLAGVQSSNALILSDHAANIARLKEIIDSIDGGKDEQIEVINLQYAWVGDLAALIEELIPAQSGRAAKGQAGRFTIVADERSNRLILKGSDPDRKRIRSLIAKLDKPFESKGVTQVIQLNYAEAVKVAELLDKVINDAKPQQDKGSPIATKAQFQADESLNALVIRAEPAVMAEAKNLVSQLDIRRAQVLIEAVIVEVSGKNNEELGVQWLVGDFESGAVGGTSFNNAGISSGSLVSDIAVTGGANSVGSLNGTFIGGVDRSSGTDIAVLLQALSTQSNTNLLSTPSVMTLDNEEAELLVGQNVPFKTGTTTNSATNPFTTISREDVGIKLNVKPQINDDNTIRLKVFQEVSSVDTTSAAEEGIITNKRSLDTSILVSDGETIVLGGLIQDDIQESVSKVPLLGDIPFLGALFRSTQMVKTKRNLMVFLRPKIIHDGDRLKAITDAKYQGIYRVNSAGEADGSRSGGSVEQLFDGARN